MIAMPLQEMRMRPVRHTSRRKRTPGFIDYRSYLLRIVGLSRNQYLQVVGQTNQTAIKHPMRRTRKGDPITDDVRAACFDGANVHGSHFCPPHPIDEL